MDEIQLGICNLQDILQRMPIINLVNAKIGKVLPNIIKDNKRNEGRDTDRMLIRNYRILRS